MGIKKWWNGLQEKKIKKKEEEKRLAIEKEIKRNDKRTTNDIIDFDFGASKIKYLLKGKENEFRSSIRIVDNIDRITTQPNFIKVNGTWYAIGENQVSPSSQLRKADKENFEIFLVYCLVREFADNGNYDINMLLPINQFDDKYKLAKKINGQYDVLTTDGRVYKYDLYLNGIFPEGEMSDYYIRQRFPEDKGNRAVGNMGFSTFDVAAFLTSGEQMPTRSYPTAMNKILVEHNQIIQADNTSVLSLWRSQGFEYSEEQIKATRELERDKINNLLNDVYAGSLSTLTPNMTTLYICGGGSVAMKYSLNKYIENTPLLKGYKVVVLEGKEALYTDLYGMALYTKNKISLDIIERTKSTADKDKKYNEIEETKNKNKEVAIDKDNFIEDIEETKEENEIKTMDKDIEETIDEMDNGDLTEREIQVIETYLKYKGTPGHTQKHYSAMLNLEPYKFKYKLGKYKKAHQEGEPIHNSKSNNIIPLTGGR